MGDPARVDPMALAVWWLTGHAIDRWQERYEPHAHRDDAALTLVTISREAQDTGAETHDGRPVFWHPSWPAARFVVARATPGMLPTLVTVLDAAEMRVSKKPGASRGRRKYG